MSNSTLKDKVALVTGGSRGIGRAIVVMLAQQGCHVAFSYQRSKEEALELEKKVTQMGVRCTASGVDVKDFNQVKSWVGIIRDQFGGLDILINNAGIINDKAFMLMTEEDWNNVLDTNLTGVFHAARACIVTFLKQRQGDIINISSVSGIMGLPGQTNYSASKGAVNAFTKALAKEVAAFGVRVNAIAPGFIETQMIGGFKPEQKEQFTRMIPLGRMGSVEDVANCVKFLLSEHARYITGQIIQVDGGLAIR